MSNVRLVLRSLVFVAASVLACAAVDAQCTLTCPSVPNVGTDLNQCGAVVNYPPPTATGTCGTVTCSPASGSFYPVASTPVTCTSSVGGASCGFSITVVDTQPPTLTCPSAPPVTIFPPDTTAVVTFATPTGSDNCPPGPVTTCTPPSGSSFPIGTTPLSCTAIDANLNSTTCVSSIVVDLGSVTEVPSLNGVGLGALGVLLTLGALRAVARRSSRVNRRGVSP